MSYITEEVQAGFILPLWLLHTDLVQRYLVTPDTAVGCSGQGDFNPNINLAARPLLEMFPFFYDASGYAFKCILRHHNEETIHQTLKGGGVAALLEARF